MEMSQYLNIFLEESKENIQVINDCLLQLEKNKDDISIVQEIFRSAHTLKGMSASMNFTDMASLTHEMENVLDLIRNSKLNVSIEIMDVLFECTDLLEKMVIDIDNGGEGKENVIVVVQKLKAIAGGNYNIDNVVVENNTTTITTNKNGINFDNYFNEYHLTVIKQSLQTGHNVLHIKVKLEDSCIMKSARVFMAFQSLEGIGEIVKSDPSVDDLEKDSFDATFEIVVITRKNKEEIHKLLSDISEVEEVDITVVNQDSFAFSFKDEKSSDNSTLTLEKEHTQSTNKKATVAPAMKSGKTIRVDIEKLDVLMNLFSELVIDRGRLEQISRESKNVDLTETVEHMSRISGDLQNLILTMRMVQIDQVFNRFPRMVRDLAKDLNKKVNLVIEGAETELDRTVIDEIGDPLVHLLRNSLDHGLETTGQRLKVGKSEEGTVKLKAYHSGNYVFIEVSDDGNGINREKVIQKAIENGIIDAQRASTLSDQKAFELIFASGFSTADKISDISGRGVGLDVVKTKIESLGGSVSIESKLGIGTTFTIQLPLTLSIIQSMLVNVQSEKYAIPLSSIIETAIFDKQEILNAHGTQVIDFRGKIIPLVPLIEILDVPRTLEDNNKVAVVIVRKNDKMAALVVDNFIGQQEIVLKALGDMVSNTFAVSGATILGDGQVALILDVNSLVK